MICCIQYWIKAIGPSNMKVLLMHIPKPQCVRPVYVVSMNCYSSLVFEIQFKTNTIDKMYMFYYFVFHIFMANICMHNYAWITAFYFLLLVAH